MIRFYLLGKKGLDCIKSLKKSHLNHVVDVVIDRDQNVQKDYAEEIQELCEQLKIPTILRKEATKSAAGTLEIAIGWRWLINTENQVLVFHDSLLPKYRGFNPLVTALINGDKEIGVTALTAGESYDTGDIIGQKSTLIDYPINIKSAIDQVSQLYVELLHDVFSKHLSKSLKGIPQEASEASYSLWRDEEDYWIDWQQSAEEIRRFIDAVGYPYKGAKTKASGHTVRILNATTKPDVEIANRTPGKVIFKDSEGFHIVCRQGLLCVSEFYNDTGEKVDLGNAFRIRFGK